MPLFVELPLLLEGPGSEPSTGFVNLDAVQIIRKHVDHADLSQLCFGRGETAAVKHSIDDLVAIIAAAKKREAGK